MAVPSWPPCPIIKRNAGALPQVAPAVDVPARQRVLDEADHRAILELPQDRQHRGHRARLAAVEGASVEVVVDAETGRRRGLGAGGMLHHVPQRRGVHLEDGVARRGGVAHLIGELGRRAGPRPGRQRHRVAPLLPHQLVGRDLEPLPHQVVQGRDQAVVEVAADKVERVAADDRLHRGPGRHRAAGLPVADEPGVGGDAVHGDLGNLPVEGEVAAVAGLVSGVDLEEVYVGDFHGGPGLPGTATRTEAGSLEGDVRRLFRRRIPSGCDGGVTRFYFSGNGNVSFCQRAVPDLVTALPIPNFMASHIREQSSDLP